jgi:hypothetical protein
MADEQTERRDRYAAAIRERLPDDLCDEDLATVSNAVLAVADAEQAELRAEVEQWRATYGRDALPGALRRLERAEQAEAVIKRVAAIADAHPVGIDTALVHEALDGWTPPAAAPAVDQAELESDEERADREETERAHASGDHQYCGPTCEVEFPSDMLRNTILYQALPGSAGMLDELLRRAAVLPDTSRAAVLHEAADIGEDIANGIHNSGDDHRAGGAYDVVDKLRRLADEAQQQPAVADTKPTVGYTGKGRIWCLLCTHPADENVPATIDILAPNEECAGCRRDVVDVARAQQTSPS